MTRGQEAKQALDRIKSLLKTGKISYDNAKYFSEEPLKILNEEMKKVNQKMGARHYPITFIKYMR